MRRTTAVSGRSPIPAITPVAAVAAQGLILALALTFVATGQEQLERAPQFAAGVSQVRVDVVVTDDDGQFVNDLGPEDFTVLEDGQPQNILQVQLVDLIAGRVTTVAGAYPEAGGGSRVPPVPDPHPSDIDPPAEKIEPGDYGAMVFVIQGGRLGYWERRRFAKAWVELLEATGEYRFPRAVFAIGYRGQLTQLTPLTYDVDQLREALDAVADNEILSERAREMGARIAPEATPKNAVEAIVEVHRNGIEAATSRLR
jgi:hypothetical protein